MFAFLCAFTEFDTCILSLLCWLLRSWNCLVLLAMLLLGTWVTWALLVLLAMLLPSALGAVSLWPCITALSICCLVHFSVCIWALNCLELVYTPGLVSFHFALSPCFESAWVCTGSYAEILPPLYVYMNAYSCICAHVLAICVWAFDLHALPLCTLDHDHVCSDLMDLKHINMCIYIYLCICIYIYKYVYLYM